MRRMSPPDLPGNPTSSVANGLGENGRFRSFLCSSLYFFTSSWMRLGHRKSMEQQVFEITGILLAALQGKDLAANRKTMREKDYSRIAMFDQHGVSSLVLPTAILDYKSLEPTIRFAAIVARYMQLHFNICRLGVKFHLQITSRIKTNLLLNLRPTPHDP